METKPIRSKVGNDQSIHAAMLQARTIRQLARAATISHVGCRHAQLTLRPGRNNSRCNPRDKPVATAQGHRVAHRLRTRSEAGHEGSLGTAALALQNDKNSGLEILLLDPQLVRAGSGYAAPMDGHHRQSTPEPTIVGWAQHLRANATVLDVAAGGGRHALWLAARGHRVTAIDRDTTALRQATLAEPASANVCIVQADLENAPWPLPEELFDAVVVVNYLWRDLLPTLFASVAPGGHLLYETFAVGNERYGRPRNPDFLLRANELQDVTPPEFDVLEFAQGEVGDPPCAVRQRLLAQRTS